MSWSKKKTIDEWAKFWGVKRNSAQAKLITLQRRQLARRAGKEPPRGTRGPRRGLWQVFGESDTDWSRSPLLPYTGVRPGWSRPFWSNWIGHNGALRRALIASSALGVVKEAHDGILHEPERGKLSYRVDLALLPEDRPHALSYWRPISELAKLLDMPRTNLERRLFEGSPEFAHYQVRESERSDCKWEARIAWGFSPEPLERAQIEALIAENM